MINKQKEEKKENEELKQVYSSMVWISLHLSFKKLDHMVLKKERSLWSLSVLNMFLSVETLVLSHLFSQ